MKIRIIGVEEGQNRIMNAYAFFGEFKPDEKLWYSNKIGQVLEVEPLNEKGIYVSRAYGHGICAKDAVVVPETTVLSAICEEEARALIAAREEIKKERKLFRDLVEKLESIEKSK